MNSADRSGKQTIFEVEMMDGYFIVRSLFSGIISPDRITHRREESYLDILLDNDARKPLVRLYFNSYQKYLGLFDENRQEEKVPIDKLNEIRQYSEKIWRVFSFYEAEEYGKKK